MTARLLFTSLTLAAASLVVAAAGSDDATISVRESGGEYLVSARFSVPEAAAVARDVLTDYASIPRFMPDVLTSVVLERRVRGATVAQEALSKFMMFSKRIYLVLEIDEGVDTIRFRDRCNRSFTSYEGAWTIGAAGERTELAYTLAARPAFGVPAIVLRRLLSRDAGVMIERLRSEISARGRLAAANLQ